MTAEDQSPGDAASAEGQPQAQDVDEAALRKEEFEEALREKEQFRTMAQRSQADLENYKRRASEELAEVRRTASSQLLIKMLSIVDDLERAAEHLPDAALASGWLEGLQLVMRNIDAILESEGVKKIEAVGRPFDPWEAEAVQHLETTDIEEGYVIKVVREGYRHHDKVLRAPQVIVARKPEPEEQSESSEGEPQ